MRIRPPLPAGGRALHASARVHPAAIARPREPPRPPPAPTADTLRTLAKQRIHARDHVQVAPQLIDSFGRKHDYLRISLTEKCNLRCTYCMPEHGVPLLPKDHLLTADEIFRTVRVFVQHGVRKIRLTGGEPTIRRDVVEIVDRLGQLGLSSLGMTSNGIALKRKLPALVDAGLTHLNLSLDTLDPFKYELMTRRRGYDAVMDSLEVAKSLASSGLHTKINVVVIRGLNDSEVGAFVELTRKSDITVRFIEYMPFEDNRWSTQKLVPSASLLAHLASLYPAAPLEKLRDASSDTTRAYRVPGYKGSFGFISSMTDHFCGGCSRLRVGADGGVKVCLFGPPVLSLRPLLRASPASPASDAAMMDAVGAAVYGKKFAHNGLGGPEGIKREGKMGPMVGIGMYTLLSPGRHDRPPPDAQETLISWRDLSIATTRPHRAASALGFPAQPAPLAPSSMRVPLHLLTPHFSSPRDWARRSFSTSPAARLDSPAKDVDDGYGNVSGPEPSPRLSHIDPTTGRAAMVSVSGKPTTVRTATAVGRVYIPPAAFDLIDFGDESSSRRRSLGNKKGDVLSVAQLAGLMGAKHTSLLIPLCHPLSLSHISVTLAPLRQTSEIEVRCTASCDGATGVEMEALTGVSVAALTVWDMCKAAAGQEMEIRGIKVVSKSGGKSGDWVRSDDGDNSSSSPSEASD